MNIDPLLLRTFRTALFYGVGAFLYFHFTDDALTLGQAAIKAAATAGIFMLLFYITARVLKRRKDS